MALHTSEQVQDAIAGICLALLGAAALYMSTSYRGGSGIYPGALGGALALLGLVLTLRAARGWSVETEPRPLTVSIFHFLLTLAISAVYLTAIPYLGFYTASLAVLALLPLALGFRRPVMLLVSAVLFLAVVYGTFSIVLERPLPREFFLL